MPDRIDLLARDFDRESIVTVRHEIERHSERAGLTDLGLYRFVVAVNEIITNAVRHGGGRGRVYLWRDGYRLHCKVTDSGPGIPAARRVQTGRPEPGTVGGWGLWLARQGCAALAVDSGATGSAVTLTHQIARG